MSFIVRCDAEKTTISIDVDSLCYLFDVSLSIKKNGTCLRFSLSIY